MIGQFISHDPAGLAVADPNNPQPWNRYAYVNGNPLSATDPLGLQQVCQIVGPSCPLKAIEVKAPPASGGSSDNGWSGFVEFLNDSLSLVGIGGRGRGAKNTIPTSTTISREVGLMQRAC